MFDTKYGDSDIVARHTEISGCGYPSTDSSLEQWSKYSGNIEKYSVIALILSIKVTVQLVEGVQMEHTYITLFKSISPQSAPCLPERMQVLGLIRRGKFQNTILAICSPTLLNCILPTSVQLRSSNLATVRGNSFPQRKNGILHLPISSWVCYPSNTSKYKSTNTAKRLCFWYFCGRYLLL